MDNKVRATLNEFENYEYYRKKSTELVEKIRLCEWDLYFNIGSSLKYEDYFEWENGRYVKKTKLKDPIHNPFSGRARHEQLEKERDDLIKRKTLVDAQISVIEYNLGLLSPDTRQIVNVCYLLLFSLQLLKKAVSP